MRYSTLDKKRKTFLNNVTRVFKQISKFDPSKHSLSTTAEWRKILETTEKGHEAVINEMFDSDEANEDEIANSIEEFQDALFNALNAIVDCEDRIEKQSNEERLISFASQIQEGIGFKQQHDATECSFEKLKMYHSIFLPLHGQFQDTFRKILPSCKDDERSSIEELRKKFCDEYADVIGWFNEEIMRRSPVSETTSMPAPNNDFSPALVRLPPVELEKFDGVPDKWVSFRDNFCSLIHSHPKLSPSAKFRYLKSSITDKHSPINHLIETDDGYNDAWNAVMNYYDDERRILDNHFNSMLTERRMTGESHEELQRLINNYTLHAASIERMFSKEVLYESIIAHLVIHRLDIRTRDLWETANKNQIPNWPDLQKFLLQRRKTLSTMPAPKILAKPAVPPKVSTNKTSWRSSNVNSTEKKLNSSSTENDEKKCTNTNATKTSIPEKTANTNSVFVPKCLMCNNQHKIIMCHDYINLTIPERILKVKEWKVCENCFSSTHEASKCTSKYSCRQCQQRHHTTLHQEVNLSTPISQSNTSCNTANSSVDQVTLMQTAIVYCQSSNGQWQVARAFLDSGSDANFITTEAAQALGLKLCDVHIEANGFGGKRAAVIRHAAVGVISNLSRSNQHELEFLVTPKVTNPTPTILVDRKSLDVPPNIQLADTKFNVPGKVDILLGNKIYGKLITHGRIQIGTGIILLNSIFGWIFTGSANSLSSISTVQCNLSTLGELKQSIEKFYKLEDYRTDVRFYTEEEAFCEEHFERHHERLADGSFSVSYPFNHKLSLLKPNDKTSFCQFLSLEKRMHGKSSLRETYGKIMEEYADVGDMTEVDITKDPPDLQVNYLPHHDVENLQSTTTPVRVVYNGSSKTSSGISINDAQCVGPNVQTDSFSLGLRFRQNPIAFKADIAKMYRQVKITPKHRPLQRIFWRSSPAEPIKVYELNTVTFGMASSAYLATRSLKQAGIDSQSESPRAAHEIINNFYVDDWLSGETNTERGLKLAHDVIKILRGAGMKLRKFSSNNQKFIDAIPEADREVTDNKTLKALGLKWNPSLDVLGFNVKPINSSTITKRIVLSEISKIYDPDGLLGPVTFRFKRFMKDVYQLQTTWDEPLPKRESDEWIELSKTFDEINNFEIPRYFLTNSPTHIQLHGFCDASEDGYGACVYIVSKNSHHQHKSHLVSAKSRIAPLEFRSIARLELCGAVLLANLITQVSKALTLKINKIFCWTDSSIVLHWLMKTPATLQTFVANRVSEIQILTAKMFWRHVRTWDNPADLMSRGIISKDLINMSLWWHGPSFLLNHESQWPETLLEIDPTDPAFTSEFKKTFVNNFTLTSLKSDSFFIKLIEDSSRTFSPKWKLAYVLRFIFNLRAKKLCLNQRSGPIQVHELNEAQNTFIRLYQLKHFPDEYRCLANGKSFPVSSKIRNLNPFWDAELNLIRVGGRLQHAICSEDQKFPILLPNCHLSKLLLREIHQTNFHGGQLATLAIARMKFWPLKAKQIIKKEVHHCVKCFHVKPTMIKQFMGSLPAPRINPAPVFHNTGVDYCGPFSIKLSSTRNSKTGIAYVAVFVCLATKAIHLEIVSKLSTDAFFCAFDKFVSRRGLPASMYSDHGLNFVGANNEMKDFYEFLRKSITQNEIHRYFLNHEVKWHFIPPRAPEHGGLWEAGVKSFKHHFYRVSKNSQLTFEEFDQFKSKIEAVLNSRPLTALSDDPNDFAALTAGHFLIGKPLVSKPEENFTDQNINRLQRWQRVTQMQQHFWQRWSKEYLHQLQVRTKNYKDKTPISVGQLVLLELENCPPLMWPLGRIVHIYPGKDDVTRVARIKTEKSTYERPVTKLALLPINPEDSQISPAEYVHA